MIIVLSGAQLSHACLTWRVVMCCFVLSCIDVDCLLLMQPQCVDMVIAVHVYTKQHLCAGGVSLAGDNATLLQKFAAAIRMPDGQYIMSTTPSYLAGVAAAATGELGGG